MEAGHPRTWLLLKRGVLSEAEFCKANEVARSQSTALEARREELSTWIGEQRTRVSTAERLPGAIQSFLADFESLDVRHQKAQLQAILKSAYVFRDDHIELEFRGKSFADSVSYFPTAALSAMP